MMINFVELQKLVPDEGRLILTFLKRKDGNLMVFFSPSYEKKEEDSVLRPVKSTGTPEELNDTWNNEIIELAKVQKLYVEASQSGISKRKEETEKAIADKYKKGPAAKDDKKETTLFSKSSKSKTKPAVKTQENSAADEENEDEEPSNEDDTGTSTESETAEEEKTETKKKTPDPATTEPEPVGIF